MVAYSCRFNVETSADGLTFGRKLTLRYTGATHDIPRYTCNRGWLDHAEPRCIAFGGLRVDDAIEVAILKVLEPGAIVAAIEAERQAAAQRFDACTSCAACAHVEEPARSR